MKKLAIEDFNSKQVFDKDTWVDGKLYWLELTKDFKDAVGEVDIYDAAIITIIHGHRFRAEIFSRPLTECLDFFNEFINEKQ